MRNLFICHSQSHLILSSGLSQVRYPDDENHLILFKDFNLKAELVEKLQRIFSSCLFIAGSFPAEKNMTILGRFKWYKEDIHVLKKAFIDTYDRVFAVCDWTYPVQYAIKCCLATNPASEMIWLEDGILPYFANSKTRKGLDRFSLTMALRKLIIKYLLRIGHVYDRDFDEMGGLCVFKQAYVSYPEAVREPYKSNKQLVAISSDEFFVGVSSLYPKVELSIRGKAILLVMDKLDTYLFPETVQFAIGKIIHTAENNSIPVFCKLHPRENDYWKVFEKCSLLDQSVGAESMYLSLSSQKDNIRVVGVKSAGLMTAVKMGFNVESLFLLSGEVNDELVNFFDLIGIKLLTDTL